MPVDCLSTSQPGNRIAPRAMLDLKFAPHQERQPFSHKATQAAPDASRIVAPNKIDAMDRLKQFTRRLIRGPADISRPILRFFTETENSLVFGRQISKKCRIEQQRMITVSGNIFFLNLDCRVVVVEERRVSWFQDRRSLTMNPRRVEQNAVPAGPGISIFFTNSSGVIS